MIFNGNVRIVNFSDIENWKEYYKTLVHLKEE